MSATAPARATWEDLLALGEGARTLEALALVDGTWRDAGSFDEDEPARIPPFDAITLELSRLFPPEQAHRTE